MKKFVLLADFLFSSFFANDLRNLYYGGAIHSIKKTAVEGALDLLWSITDKALPLFHKNRRSITH